MAARLLLGLIVSSALLLGTSSSFATVFNAKKLHADLKTKKTTWVAKDNHLSQLSVEELKRMMGYKKPFSRGIDFSTPELSLMSNRASLLDWRNKDGQNWVSPMLDQGNCGSCVAFATVGTLETQMNITRVLPWLNPKFSTQALFACGGGGCETGWYPGAAAQYVQSRGVPDEACAPYTMGANGQDVSCSSICADSSSRSQKVASFKAYSGADQVKAALAHGPVVTTMEVYSDFVLYSSGIYKHVSGDILGGHAISIVGYNDVDRYWIIRNSWSTFWGENGYAMVSYDDVSGVGDEGWSFNVPNTSGIVAIENLSDRDYLAGQVHLKAMSTYANTNGLTMKIVGAAKSLTLNCTGASECDFNFDSASVPDGRYEVIVQATTQSGVTAQSEKKYFYVLNGTPSNVGVSFTAKGFDIASRLSGRVEFDVTTSSSPIPMTEIEFQVIKDGKIVLHRANRNILPQMSIGWRTINVPNGQYQITLVGRVIVGDKVYTQQAQTYNVTVQN